MLQNVSAGGTQPSSALMSRNGPVPQQHACAGPRPVSAPHSLHGTTPLEIRTTSGSEMVVMVSRTFPLLPDENFEVLLLLG